MLLTNRVVVMVVNRLEIGAGDNSVVVSVGTGIVPNNRKRGGTHELDVW